MLAVTILKEYREDVVRALYPRWWFYPSTASGLPLKEYGNGTGSAG